MSWNGTSPRAPDWVGLPQRAEGVITGVNARGEFRVKLVNGQLVHATMCEELHEWFVRLLPGDKVEVDLENPHGKRRVIVDRRLPEGRSLLAALRSWANGTPFPPSLDS